MSAAGATQDRTRNKYPVFTVVSSASAEEVSELLKGGHSPDKSPPGAAPPLYRAVRFNRPHVALLLLRAGCRVTLSKKLQQRHPPIVCLAADLKQTEVVLELCQNPECDISARNDSHQTIVHLAVARRNYDLMKRLPWCCLARRAASDTASKVQLCSFLMNFATMPDGQFMTPLHLAASLGDLNMLKLLIRMQTFFKTHFTPLLSTTSEDKAKQGDQNPSSKIEINTCVESACQCDLHNLTLRSASDSSDSSSCRTLHINDNSGNCISFANSNSCCRTDSVSCFTNSSGPADAALSMNQKFPSCVSHPIDSKKGDCEPGSMACDNTSTCKYHQQAGSLPVQDSVKRQLINQRMIGSKDTMLHFAARGQHLQVMEFLLNEGAEVNVQNLMGNTPLHLLCMNGRARHRALAAARLLLAAGADCSLKGSIQQPMNSHNKSHNHSLLHPKADQRGLTVAMIAAVRNRVAYLKLLGEFGVKFDEVNALNMTVLMLALKHGSEEAALYLLTNQLEEEKFRSGFDVQGFRALHYVSHCKSKAVQLTKLLLVKGYEVTGKLETPSYPHTSGLHSRPNLQSPLVYSIQQRQLGVLQMLVKHQPQLLLMSSGHDELSPLHAILAHIPGKESAPFIDFLLEHGADGNAVVGGRTPYELAVLMFGPEAVESDLFAPLYLRQKLGPFFLLPDRACLEHKCQTVRCLKECEKKLSPLRLRRRETAGGTLSLRDLCCCSVRQTVRENKGDYHAQISSLPLPSCVIHYLLFKTVYDSMLDSFEECLA